MPQHKHVTVELLRLSPTAFAAELATCSGRGTTLHRNDPTGTAVSVIEHSLTGKYMLQIDHLVPSLPRESDAVTLSLAEAAFARGGNSKVSKSQFRERVVSFTAYPDLDGYVDHASADIPVWCLLIANSHSEFDMAVDVRLIMASALWDHEYVPYVRPVIVRTDSFVVIKLVEAQVLPDPLRIAVEWFHVRSTFTLGETSGKPIVKMQIDPQPYVLFDIFFEPTIGNQMADTDALRVARQEGRMALDLAIEEFENDQLLIPTATSVHDKIQMARYAFKSILDSRKQLRVKAEKKKQKQISRLSKRTFEIAGTSPSSSSPQLSSASLPTRKQRLKLKDPILRSVSRGNRSFTTLLGSAGVAKKNTKRNWPAPTELLPRPSRSAGFDATLAPVIYPPPPTILITPDPQPAALYPPAFNRAPPSSGADGNQQGTRLSRGQASNTSSSEVVELLSDTSNDVEMEEGGDGPRGTDDGNDIVTME